MADIPLGSTGNCLSCMKCCNSCKPRMVSNAVAVRSVCEHDSSLGGRNDVSLFHCESKRCVSTLMPQWPYFWEIFGCFVCLGSIIVVLQCHNSALAIDLRIPIEVTSVLRALCNNSFRESSMRDIQSASLPCRWHHERDLRGSPCLTTQVLANNEPHPEHDSSASPLYELVLTISHS